jgi:hypothetical protein
VNRRQQLNREALGGLHLVRRRFLVVLLAAFLSLAPLLHADTIAGGTITLLPGYRLTASAKCMDSCGGRIWKEGGLKIYYDNLIDAGIYATEPRFTKDARWTQEQLINGQKALIVFTRKRELIVSFPEGQVNFYATIRNEREMAEMLLTIGTFDGHGGSHGD